MDAASGREAITSQRALQHRDDNRALQHRDDNQETMAREIVAWETNSLMNHTIATLAPITGHRRNI